MKKQKTIFNLSLASLMFAFAGVLISVVSTSSDNIQAQLESYSSGTWVHYAQKNATKSEKGIREYWIQCGGAGYQFTAPAGVTPEEGTTYDTSLFEENDPRYILYSEDTVFYDLNEGGTPEYAYDSNNETITSSSYSLFGDPSITTGTEESRIFVPSTGSAVQAKVLTVSNVISTADEFTQLNTTVRTAAKESETYSYTNKYYALKNDIASVSYSGSFDSVTRIKNVVVDGRGHTIKKLDMWHSGGIFGIQYLENTTIKDLNFENVTAGTYGLFGYVTLYLTLDNVNITSKYHASSAPSLLGREINKVTIKNCTFDHTANPTKVITDILKTTTFTDTKILLDCQNKQKLCNTKDGVTYVENYDEEGITWSYKGLTYEAAAAPTFNTAGHIAGYTCSICGKHFSDAKHTTEITEENWTVAKLTYTEVTDKIVFYNLSTSSLDFSEVSPLTINDFVDGDLNAVSSASFTSLSAGDTASIYIYAQGGTNYKYTVLAVSDVIASADDWNENLSGVSNDVTGYYVLTADIESLTTECGSDSGNNDHNNTTLVNVTIDGRGHTISNLKVTSKKGGMFATCGIKGTYFLTIKNLIVASAKRAHYGFLGYMPANGGDSDSVRFENFDFTVGEGYTNGVFAATNPSPKFTFKDCRFDMRKGGTKLFNTAGTLGSTFEGTTTILVNTAWDANATNCCEIVRGNLANERDGLTSKIPGVVFTA